MDNTTYGNGPAMTALARFDDSTQTGDRCYAQGDDDYARQHWLDAAGHLDDFIRLTESEGSQHE